MTAEEALDRLRELFPVAQYQTQLALFTNGSVEIEVFFTQAEADKRQEDCLNVISMEGDSIDDCVTQVQDWEWLAR